MTKKEFEKLYPYIDKGNYIYSLDNGHNNKYQRDATEEEIKIYNNAAKFNFF